MCNPLLCVYSLPCTGEPRQAQPRSTPWLQPPGLAWRDGATSGSITRPPTAAFTAPPATHSHTDQLYTWLKPFLKLPCPISSSPYCCRILCGSCCPPTWPGLAAWRAPSSPAAPSSPGWRSTTGETGIYS